MHTHTLTHTHTHTLIYFSYVFLQIYPTGEECFEIPPEALDITSPPMAANQSTRLYDVTFHSHPIFGFAVTRRATNATM